MNCIKSVKMSLFLMLTIVIFSCEKKQSQLKQTESSAESSPVICSPDKVCIDLSDSSSKVSTKPLDQPARDRFQSILDSHIKDSDRRVTEIEKTFLSEYGLSERFLAFKNTNAFFRPFLKLLFDKEFQEAKSRKKLELLPENLKKLGSVFNKVIPSLALVLTISLAAFLGVMNAQCLGIMEKNMGTPVNFVQYEDTFNPKTQFEMFFFDCAANDVDCIHMAVRLENTIYHGGGPISGTSLFSLPLPESAPLRNWNGMAKVFSTSYEDFKNPSWGLTSNHSLTSVRLQLPELEIQNLKKYYSSRNGQLYNYWAFPPVSTCTTVARDAIEASTSVKFPPVIQDFPGANEAFLKLSQLFGDKRIVSIVRNQGKNDAWSTPKEIMAKRALHLGAQSAALLVTPPATILEEMGGNQIHFTPGDVFSFNELYFGKVRENPEVKTSEP